MLLDKGAEERMPPASMAKVMTAYLVFDMLKQGRAKLEDELPVSEARLAHRQGSKMFVPLGGRIKIEDLVQGMVIQSGNDACVVLAEGLAGSQQAFVEQMNQKAKEIGLQGQPFRQCRRPAQPRTLDDGARSRDPGDADDRGLSRVLQVLLGEGIQLQQHHQGNRNPLLYKDIGADGLKTGHTEEAGYSLTRLGAARQPAHHRGAERLADDEGARAGKRAADRMGVPRVQQLQAVRRRRKIEDAEVWLGAEPKVPLTVDEGLWSSRCRASRART